MDRSMLRKFEIRVIALLFYAVTQAVFAFTPTAQQIQQLKTMPRAQQKTLARQMGIELFGFQLNSSPSVNIEPETVIARRVDENAVSKTSAEQSAAQNNSKSLKPYGYQLFSNPAASFSPSPNMPVYADYLMGAGDSSKVYIVKANGALEVPNNDFWFTDTSAILEPSDNIVVPRDVVNYERLGLWQTVTEIVYQSALALVAIGRL